MRLRQIALASRSLDRPRDEIADVFGLGAPFADPGVATFGLHNAVFPVGDTFLEVVAPAQEGTAAGRFLERRGDGGYMVIVQSHDRAADVRRVRNLGIRIVWEVELPDISTIHLHPRDVGGAILSLDVADPPASWRWAGPHWEARTRTDVSTGLVGVEIEAPDPAALAQRWSRILDLPVGANGAAPLAIRLDGGCIRFVDAKDDREAGVSCVDVAVVDRARVLARAKRRGLVHGDDEISLCGTRFRLLPA